MTASHPIARAFGRWILRGLVAAGGAGLALALATTLCLPWLAERALEQVLAQHGLGQVHVGVRAVAWRGAMLGPVAVRDAGGLLYIDDIAVRYTLAGLRRGQVDEIRLNGLRWPVRQRGGTWSVAGLDTLRRLAELAGQDAATPRHGDLLLRLGGARLELTTDRGALAVPFEGMVHLPGRGPCRLWATAWPLGEPLTLEASFDLDSGDAVATIDSPELDLAAALRAAALVGVVLPDSAPEVLAGQVSGHATIVSAGRALVRVQAEALASSAELRLAGVPLAVRDLEVSLQAGAALRLAEAVFSGHSGPVRVGDQLLEPFAFAGVWRGDTAECQLSALEWSLADGSAGLRGSAHVSVVGVTAPATATLWLDAEVADLTLPGGGSFAGTLSVVGNARELCLSGVLEAAGGQDPFGVETLIVDSHLRHRAGLAGELLLTAFVQPALVGAALAPAMEVAGALRPVELAAAFERPVAGPWRCAGTLALPDGHLGLSTATAKGAADVAMSSRFAVAPAGLDLSAELTLAAVTAAGAGATVSAQALRLSVQTAHVPLPALTLALPSPALAALLAGLRVEGHVSLSDATVRGPGAVTCDAIALELPFAWTLADGWRTPAAGGTLRAGPARRDPLAAASLDGRVFLEGRRARLTAVLAGTTPALSVDLEQTVDWDRDLALALHYRIAPFSVHSDDTWYRIGPALSGLRLQGRISAEGDLRVDAQGVRAPCRVVVEAGEVDWPAQKLTLAGLSADLHWRDLVRAQTEPFQEVRFTAAKFHDVPIDGGRLVFQLDGPQSFCLQRCELNWCKGLVHTQALQINPAHPEVDMVLFAENVDFISALELIKGFKGKGTGVLNGKLPISYRQGRLSYSKGYLYSVPGQPGRVELQSAGLLTSAVPADHPNYDELRRAERALEEFRLDLFRLDFVGKQVGAPGAKILLVGEGVREKVPLHLNLNVNGAIEDAINVGLRLGGM